MVRIYSCWFIYNKLNFGKCEQSNNNFNQNIDSINIKMWFIINQLIFIKVY